MEDTVGNQCLGLEFRGFLEVLAFFTYIWAIAFSMRFEKKGSKVKKKKKNWRNLSGKKIYIWCKTK